jgi:hypothetical protein
MQEADKDANGEIDLKEFQIGVSAMPLLHDCYTLVAAGGLYAGSAGSVQASPLGRDVYGKEANPYSMTATPANPLTDPAAQRRAALSQAEQRKARIEAELRIMAEHHMAKELNNAQDSKDKRVTVWEELLELMSIYSNYVHIW